jgi:hypothetical protein
VEDYLILVSGMVEERFMRIAIDKVKEEISKG